MPAGYGELNIMKRLNRTWEGKGHCIRLAQRKGDPEALSDLIFGIKHDDTYSIEVKRITNKKIGVNRKRPKTRPLSFSGDFSITTRDIEYQHQLVRQTAYCRMMGWIPLVMLQVVSPSVRTDEYLFNSYDLYDMMVNGEKSLLSQDFPKRHNQLLYDYLFGVDKGD